MGYDSAGQLGDGAYNNTNRPEQIVASNVVAIAAGEEHSLFLKSDGSLWGMGNNEYGQLGDGTYYFSTNRPQQIVASNVTPEQLWPVEQLWHSYARAISDFPICSDWR
jgi:alpha-tubulin suppressor-like RCC1 family protein